MKSQIDYTRLNDPFIVNCALCRKRIKDVRWEERLVTPMGWYDICINVNCHGRYWSCIFTRAELMRKMKHGLIELLAFENDSYLLTREDIGKENKMTEVNMTEKEYKNAVKQTEDQISFNEKSKDDEKKEIKVPIKEGDLQDKTVSRLIKEQVKEDSAKETVLGRRGCVEEGKAEPKEFTNKELMKKFGEIEHQNRNLMERFVKVWDKIAWLEKLIKEKPEYLRFSHRLKISNAAIEWCRENDVNGTSLGIITALDKMEIMDTKKAVAWCQDKKIE